MPTGETTGLAARPNRFPWPPVLITIALAIAWTGDAVRPLRWEGPPAFHLGAGIATIVAGVFLLQWAFRAFRRAKANILPHRAATKLITTGPFALSRNPIYLSEAIILTGLGLLYGSVWYAVALAFFIPAVTVLAIRREEIHMAALFGTEWQDYAGRVRRWL